MTLVTVAVRAIALRQLDAVSTRNFVIRDGLVALLNGPLRSGVGLAVASSVFVATITDVVGFFVFLGLAALYLMQAALKDQNNHYGLCRQKVNHTIMM